MSPIYTKKLILQFKFSLLRIEFEFKIMKNGFLQHKSSFEKISYFIALCLISKLIFLSISSVFFGISLLDIDSVLVLEDPSAILNLKIVTLLDQIGTFLLPSIIFAKLIHPSPNNIWFFRKINTRTISLILPFFIIVILVSYLLLQVNQSIDLSFFSPEIEASLKNSQKIRDQMHHAFVGNSFMSYLFNIIIMAIVPAFCEELAFRGIFQNLCSKWTGKIHVGIVLSALLFAMLHFQFYNFFALLFVGLFFGYIVAFTGTIWITIIIHFLYNLFSLTILFLSKKGVTDMNSKFEHLGFVHLFLLLLSVGIVFYVLRKNNKLKDTENLYLS